MSTDFPNPFIRRDVNQHLGTEFVSTISQGLLIQMSHLFLLMKQWKLQFAEQAKLLNWMAPNKCSLNICTTKYINIYSTILQCHRMTHYILSKSKPIMVKVVFGLVLPETSMTFRNLDKEMPSRIFNSAQFPLIRHYMV